MFNFHGIVFSNDFSVEGSVVDFNFDNSLYLQLNKGAQIVSQGKVITNLIRVLYLHSQ